MDSAVESTTDRRRVLTRREQEILVYVAHGLRNIEIANELHVAESTVKSHLTSAYVKLGVSNRTQAAIATLSTTAFETERSA